MTEETFEPGIYFHGFGRDDQLYPAWRYHKWFKDIVVNNTEEDEEAKSKGYINVRGHPFSSANKHYYNWKYDFDEMSARKMALYAKEEFNVNLPYQAGRKHLFKLIYDLYKASPASRDRIIYFAQTVELDYDQIVDHLKDVERNIEQNGEWERTVEYI